MTCTLGQSLLNSLETWRRVAGSNWLWQKEVTVTDFIDFVPGIFSNNIINSTNIKLNDEVRLWQRLTERAENNVLLQRLSSLLLRSVQSIILLIFFRVAIVNKFLSVTKMKNRSFSDWFEQVSCGLLLQASLQTKIAVNKWFVRQQSVLLGVLNDVPAHLPWSCNS